MAGCLLQSRTPAASGLLLVQSHIALSLLADGADTEPPCASDTARHGTARCCCAGAERLEARHNTVVSVRSSSGTACTTQHNSDHCKAAADTKPALRAAMACKELPQTLP
ncbi:hypothetical protein E2C01_024035 [Portunus trituberculatus]|uniref:Secreted protein n=1 Tax=Portunus trituberculatus TaxID=210409 RepID=A0A5B7EBM2_PORTR|nr:hypothetical protein [Portunus trituberculatus]